MEIEIHGKHESQMLKLSNITAVGGDEYGCDLNVNCTWFSCERRFYFGRRQVGDFIAALDSMNGNTELPVGTAELSADWESHVIRITYLSPEEGGVVSNFIVTCEFYELGISEEFPQVVKFSFWGDEDYLPKLAEKMRTLIDHSD